MMFISGIEKSIARFSMYDSLLNLAVLSVKVRESLFSGITRMNSLSSDGFAFVLISLFASISGSLN